MCGVAVEALSSFTLTLLDSIAGDGEVLVRDPWLDPPGRVVTM